MKKYITPEMKAQAFMAEESINAPEPSVYNDSSFDPGSWNVGDPTQIN